MSEPLLLRQYAPYPDSLVSLVQRLTYKKGWHFELKEVERDPGTNGLTLCILIETRDSYNSDRLRSVMHYFIVPAATYDERAWTRWLLDQILLVEQHEACEFFKIDNDRPFSPNHGPGRNPYSIIEKGNRTDARTMFTGEVRK